MVHGSRLKTEKIADLSRKLSPGQIDHRIKTSPSLFFIRVLPLKKLSGFQKG
jgi:hypothetical protein